MKGYGDRAEAELTMVAVYRDDSQMIPVQRAYDMVVADWSRVARSFVRSLHAYQSVSRMRMQRLERTARTAVAEVQAVVVDAPAAPPTIGSVRRPALSPAPSEDGAARRCLLTRRQLEIAELIAQGLSNEEIAGTLVLTPGTVGNHVGHILRKLGARNRAQVATWVTKMVAIRS
jgi:DNA-binding NarL/FixJ family response regulator